MSQKLTIEVDIPDGVDIESAKREVSAHLGKIGRVTTDEDVSEEGSAQDGITKDWLSKEQAKEAERLRQKKKSDEERRNYDEEILELVNKIPDSSLSTLCQCLPPEMRLAKKYEMMVEEVERKKAELESDSEETPASKIYGRGNSY